MEIKGKVLIVDDSSTFLMHLTSILKQFPQVDIVTFKDPLEAISQLEEHSPDVILTDFEMPGINGDEFCKEVRKKENYQAIPLMMLTSKEGDAPLLNAIHSGADDYLCKSSSEEVIKIKIASLFRQKAWADQRVKMKQFEAIKSFIILANHEFNNSLTISNGNIRKLEPMLGEKESTILAKVKSSNERISKVVEKLTLIEKFEEEEYVDGVSMLKLD